MIEGGLTVMNCLKMIVIICRLNDRGISMMHHDITFVATVNGLTVHWGAGLKSCKAFKRTSLMPPRLTQGG